MDQRNLIEQEVILGEELARRRASDPLLAFKPHPKQQQFIEAVLNDIQSENWFIAANRSGKSDAGAYIGAQLARFGDRSPDLRFIGAKGSDIQVRDRSTSGWVVAVDFPSSRDVIQPKYFDNGFGLNISHEAFIPKREVEEWRAGDQILKLKNGSLIGFKSSESGREKFQGAEKNWIHFDEEPPKNIYQEAVIRVGAQRLRVFGTCTILPPEGVKGGVSWIYSEKIKPWQEGILRTIGIYGASIYDNPYLPSSEIERLETIYPEGSIERRIRLGGELLPGLSGTRAYPGFSSLLHVKRLPDLHPRRPLCWCMDFNVDPLCSLVCQREGNLFRVFDEIIIEGGGVDRMCEIFIQRFPHHMAEVWIYGDATSKGRSKQTGKSDYTVVLNNMIQYKMPFRLKVPDSNPSVIDRVNSVNQTLMNSRGEPWLEVDLKCKELIEDLEQVLRDAHGGIKKSYQNNDPYARRTHTSDALGYYIAFENPVRRTSLLPSSGNKVKQPSYTHRQQRAM